MSEQGPPQGPPERPHLTLVPEAGIPDAPLDVSVAATSSGVHADIHVPTVSEMAIPSRAFDGAISTLAQRRRRVSRSAQHGTESQASGDPSESGYPWLSKYPTDQLIAFVGLSRRTSSDTYDPKPVEAATDIILGRKLDQLEGQREKAKREREAALPKRLKKIKNSKHGESKNPVWDIERSDEEREHTLAELESLAKQMDPSYESSDGSISRMPGVASPKLEAQNMLRRMDNMAKERKREEEFRKNPYLRQPTEEDARRIAAVAKQTAEREARLREQSEILSRRQRAAIRIRRNFLVRGFLDTNTNLPDALKTQAADRNYKKFKHGDYKKEHKARHDTMRAERVASRTQSTKGEEDTKSNQDIAIQRRKIAAGALTAVLTLGLSGDRVAEGDKARVAWESVQAANRVMAADELGSAVMAELVELAQATVERRAQKR